MAESVLDLVIKLKDEASAGLGDIASKVGDMAKVAAGIGVAGLTAVTAASAAAVKTTLDWTEQLDGLGDVLGTSARESAGLAVAIEGVGGNVDNITNQLSFMQKGLYGAKGALGTSGEALKTLGINVKDAGFKSATATDQFQQIATKIDAMPDGLEKSALMMKIFGKSGKDMSDVMHAAANGGLDEAMKKADEYGLVLSEDAAAANIKFGQGMNDLSLMMKGLAVTAGSELLPIIIPLAQQFGAFAREHMPQVREAIQGVIQVFTNLAQQIIPIVSGAFEFITKAIDDVGTAFNDAYEFTSGLGEQLGATIDLVFGTGETFQEFGSKVDTAFAAVQQAFTDVVAWVQSNWPAFRDAIVNTFNDVVAWVQTNWPPFRDAIVNTFTEIVAWVQANWPQIQTIIVSVVDTIKGLVQQGLDGIRQFWQDNGAQIMEIASLAWEVIKTAVSAAVEFIKSIVGSNLDETSGKVTSVMDIIKTAFQVAWDAIKLAIGVALDLIKGILKAALDLMHGDTDKALNDIREAFDSIWNRIKAVLGPVVESIKKVVTDMLTAIKTAADTELAKIKQYFHDRFDDAIKAITGMIGTARSAAESLVNGIKAGIDAKINAVKEAILGPIRAAIEDVKGLIAGLEARWNAIKSAVANFRLPSFSPPANNPPPSSTSNEVRSSSAFASQSAPVIINVYASGASQDDVLVALNRALKQAGVRADALRFVG